MALGPPSGLISLYPRSCDWCWYLKQAAALKVGEYTDHSYSIKFCWDTIGPGIDMDVYPVHNTNHNRFMQYTLYNGMQWTCVSDMNLEHKEDA